MNLHDKKYVRVQSLTFNSRIPDDKLRELMAPGEILKIERGSWISFMEFRSDEDAHTLGKRLETWFEDRQEEERARRAIEEAAIYEAAVKKCWDNVPGLPALRTRRGKPTLKGYGTLDDNGKWTFVFPEDQQDYEKS